MMKKAGVGFSLRSRLTIAIALLMTALVSSILFFIENREVRTFYDESRNTGIILARQIVNLNLHLISLYDVDRIKKNFEDLISEKLIYIIYYDRGNLALAYNSFVEKFPDILNTSKLPSDITPDSTFAGVRALNNAGRLLRVLEVEVPVFIEGDRLSAPSRWGSIKIGFSLEDMHASIKKTRQMLILIGCGGLLIGIVGAVLLARGITKPVKRLVEGTVRVSRGDFSHQIPISSTDEIGELAKSFNEMSRHLLQSREQIEEANRKLIQAEKLASIGRLSATIAHEIRNPLTSVKLNIQKAALNEHLDDTEREHLNISQEGIGQIEKFIKELLNFTRVAEMNAERFSIVQITEEAIKMMADTLKQKNIQLERKYEDNLPQIMVDGDKMRQVFLNVLRNACEAMNDSGGRIVLSLSFVSAKDGRKIHIKISDSGSGIPKKDWETIFEPFYTTKPTGFGLGLSNARKIVEQHKGVIRVVRKSGRGTTFDIVIPCEGET